MSFASRYGNSHSSSVSSVGQNQKALVETQTDFKEKQTATIVHFPAKCIGMTKNLPSDSYYKDNTPIPDTPESVIFGNTTWQTSTEYHETNRRSFLSTFSVATC
ncbi:hypothetical protein DPMN_161358 [Dreissena polymorpha]|uniref:Uncharacterized protein n=1 Tax=Dreissena polymorpha TaxID=45954 RepID=A0A9D4ESW0_DREPO|nr:hypothetical protein DPMN_161358 [Dreissena polymorpha]